MMEKREPGTCIFRDTVSHIRTGLPPSGSFPSERNRAGLSHTSSELDRMGIGPSHTHTRQARAPQSLATGGAGGRFRSRRAPAQFTEEEYNRLIQQSASSRPEEPRPTGSSLLLAHTDITTRQGLQTHPGILYAIWESMLTQNAVIRIINLKGKLISLP